MASVKKDLIGCIPSLRAFAMSLSGRRDTADDLVQETLTKAWANMASFQEGSNLRAWLFTILRNEYYSILRKRWREVEDADGKFAAGVGTAPTQRNRLDLNDLQVALAKLPPDQREALLLVSASDTSYEDAAVICGVAVGTVKSRLSRARQALSALMKISSTSDFGADQTVQAALSAPVEN